MDDTDTSNEYMDFDEFARVGFPNRYRPDEVHGAGEFVGIGYGNEEEEDASKRAALVGTAPEAEDEEEKEAREAEAKEDEEIKRHIDETNKRFEEEEADINVDRDDRESADIKLLGGKGDISDSDLTEMDNLAKELDTKRGLVLDKYLTVKGDREEEKKYEKELEDLASKIREIHQRMAAADRQMVRNEDRRERRERLAEDKKKWEEEKAIGLAKLAEERRIKKMERQAKRDAEKLEAETKAAEEKALKAYQPLATVTKRQSKKTFW
eukprot:jgi/Mesvir1/7752/Mv11695-RA.1